MPPSPNPTTELLEAISRWPAGDAYAMQVKQMAEQWAREVIAENERLLRQLKAAGEWVTVETGEGPRQVFVKDMTIAQLEAENECLKQALTYYADPLRYQFKPHAQETPILSDMGETACNALESCT